MQRLRPLVARVLRHAATDAFERRPMSASSGKAERAKNWVSKSFNRKTLKSAFGLELADLTRAARIKNLLARPKLAKTQTRQPTATPREAGCKTRAVPRSKRQKTYRCQNATKRVRHAALTPTNGWHSGRQACLRDWRDAGPRALFRATQTSVVDADARTASLKNAPPRCETTLRQRLPEAPRRELHPAHAAGVHRPRAARLPRPPCLRGFTRGSARHVVAASMA